MSTYLLKVIKIPTQKGDHSCKFTELSLYRKDNNVVKSNTIISFSNHVIIVVSQLTFPLFKSNGFVRELCYIHVRGDLFANGVQNNLVFRRLHNSKPTCCCVVLIV